MSGYRSGTGALRDFRVLALLLVAWWGWMPLCFGLYKLFLNLFTPGVGTWHQDIHVFMTVITAGDAGVWGLWPWTWLWFGIGFVGTAAIIWVWAHENDRLGVVSATAIVLSALLVFTSIYPFWVGMWDRDKDGAHFYLQNTTVYLEDVEHYPDSLQLMFTQKRAVPEWHGDVLHIGQEARVRQGTLPLTEWRTRSSSFKGALESLNEKSGAGPGTDIFEPTVSYAYGANEEDDAWTAILDGSRYANPMVGVAEWRGGQSLARVCKFDTQPSGTYRFTRAFNGGHMNNLRNVLALEYPDLVYEDEDIAGFCDSADKPVIVIAVTRYVGWRATTEKVPAGVLVLRGSPSGYPAIEYKPVVRAGEYPVAVYPLSIARKQREQLEWLAGRGNMQNANFGFEPSTFASQAGNNGEYVLKSKEDGRVVALTPLTASASQSQLFVNWVTVPVDYVNDGELNPLSSYILPNTPANNIKLVDPQSLDSLAQQLVQRSPTHSNFINSGGVIREYVPTGPNKFRGYGEDKNGATILYVDVTYDPGNLAKATVVSLDSDTGSEIGSIEVSLDTTGLQPGGEEGSGGSSGAVCEGKDAKDATIDEIMACLQAYQDELERRARDPQATPTVTATPTSSPTPAVTQQN